jgi:hypothetical protein
MCPVAGRAHRHCPRACAVRSTGASTRRLPAPPQLLVRRNDFHCSIPLRRSLRGEPARSQQYKAPFGASHQQHSQQSPRKSSVMNPSSGIKGDEVAAIPQSKPPRIQHFSRNSSEPTPDLRHDRGSSVLVIRAVSQHAAAAIGPPDSIVTLPLSPCHPIRMLRLRFAGSTMAHLIRDRERLRPGTAPLPLLSISRVQISEARDNQTS